MKTTSVTIPMSDIIGAYAYCLKEEIEKTQSEEIGSGLCMPERIGSQGQFQQVV